ncbi:hypothetical protein CKAN_01600100 [Cinnamomum micranthum f. kanehirae]|uniref:Uncharacterized protein n=1 Tax=Cinnamomum micranthum f. kanehirae TaxID=337451 RepID=A0A3S3NGC8_9MAGN|nr:hypothetical protein CKAN_01600100 [Cinnamomum micranthum f. kanehirae]
MYSTRSCWILSPASMPPWQGRGLTLNNL